MIFMAQVIGRLRDCAQSSGVLFPLTPEIRESGDGDWRTPNRHPDESQDPEPRMSDPVILDPDFRQDDGA
jgi:hypothetical protein